MKLNPKLIIVLGACFVLAGLIFRLMEFTAANYILFTGMLFAVVGFVLVFYKYKR